MQSIANINDFLAAINRGLGILLAWTVVALIFGYIFSFVRKNLRKRKEDLRSGKEPKYTLFEILVHGFLLTGIGGIIILIFLILPGMIQPVWIGWMIRWLEVLAGVVAIAYILGHEKGEKRWLFSAVGHYAVVLFGWLVDRWLGVLFISIPFLATYYGVLYEMSHILVPASNPEDKEERKKRFRVLVSYTWGMQFPLIVVGEHAWKKPEIRIPGDFTYDSPFPGLIWTKSHQVAAVTGGNQFKRVDGPGVVFTGKLERPFQIIDLRLQLRTNEIDVVSKDGMNFKARVFTAFRIDNEDWDEAIRQKLERRNPLLREAAKLDYREGSFRFSHRRVMATLSVTSSRASETDEPIFWDQWALNVVENTARKVVAEKNLDELWKPADDKKFANALEVIAQEIKERCFETLRAAGILLYAARIVNFSFPPGNEIEQQQIASWGAKWIRKRNEKLAAAQAEAIREQQEARAYAEAMLLNSIAEGLQKTQEIHPHLPRYVIARRFLSALQEYLHKQISEGTTSEEAKKRMGELQNYLREWQNAFFPGSNKG